MPLLWCFMNMARSLRATAISRGWAFLSLSAQRVVRNMSSSSSSSSSIIIIIIIIITRHLHPALTLHNDHQTLQHHEVAITHLGDVFGPESFAPMRGCPIELARKDFFAVFVPRAFAIDVAEEE